MSASATALTSKQVLQLPAMPTAQDAFAALGISRDLGYQLIKDGEFPVEVIKFGARALRVRRSDLLNFLGLSETAAAEVQSAAATSDDGAPGVQPKAPSEQPAPTSASK
ncbi:AlpA family transcriptional regulator [Streptomyces shenzhenensis]|uniref:DNA-binding protein n=1 Tax=Streptomyces shenzhenensis TaxID=943815 RepID=A0A3M0HXL2_9ACTN|nr:helix-turn-helix domain-containing protein [Streptomyces shenzhenensis]RMB81304.1 hypothetical protein CTZ28_35485 [Streptomyces shenzhenensis]